MTKKLKYLGKKHLERLLHVVSIVKTLWFFFKKSKISLCELACFLEEITNIGLSMLIDMFCKLKCFRNEFEDSYFKDKLGLLGIYKLLVIFQRKHRKYKKRQKQKRELWWILKRSNWPQPIAWDAGRNRKNTKC